MHFEVQESTPDKLTDGTDSPYARDPSQPWVLPSVDYAYIPDMPLAGGQLSVNVNTRVLQRDRLDRAFATPYDMTTDVQRVRGLAGNSGRLTGEVEWKRSLITDGGLVVTPLLAFQGDVDYVSVSGSSLAAVNQMAANPVINTTADMRSSFARYMATAGLEMRWPVLFSGVGSSHIVEPLAQLFVRPNEQYIGGLAIPNEDAQSFVFDASTLFERDKFSGYDRIEGGTRANVGVRYSGSYDNGWTTNAIFGQSYQLAGVNSFASPDLVNAGAESGLETATSDFVGLIGATTPTGFSASLSGRFDEHTFESRRTEVKLAYSGASPISVSAQYAFIESQPLYGLPYDREEVTLGGSARINQNWRVFGSGTYDLHTDLVTSKGIGFAYDDECFTYMMSFSESQTANPITRIRAEPTQSIGFNLSFRTLGDFGTSSSNFTE
jgi:LPS-assembly protein